MYFKPVLKSYALIIRNLQKNGHNVKFPDNYPNIVKRTAKVVELIQKSKGLHLFIHRLPAAFITTSFNWLG
ncbi:MAG: hypothetical protein A1D16_03725 [Flavihumibacter sp. CACIAM 22H1]|nr:MAG: hypothetical protein A1D16_03725 [Flavihumibacter sp. CACIAM 22H1]